MTLSDLIRRIAAEFMAEEPYSDPGQINQGQCEEFAAIVSIRYQEEIDEWGDQPILWWDNDKLGVDFESSPWPAHAFLEFQGRYYDSECPEGVDDWQQLPIFKAWTERYVPSTLQLQQSDM